MRGARGSGEVTRGSREAGGGDWEDLAERKGRERTGEATRGE